jgi:WD40 repeat protein
MATAHEDGHVSLWDIRASPHHTVKGAVSLDASAGLPLASAQAPHRRLAAQVSWCPEDANRIASVGHDGQACVLDPRSPKMPLMSVRVGRTGHTPTKLLCAAWLGREAIAVGCSDGKVVQVSLKGGTATAEA